MIRDSFRVVYRAWTDHSGPGSSAGLETCPTALTPEAAYNALYTYTQGHISSKNGLQKAYHVTFDDGVWPRISYDLPWVDCDGYGNEPIPDKKKQYSS